MRKLLFFFGIGDNLIVYFIADFGEDDVGGLGEFLLDWASGGIYWVIADRYKQLLVFKKHRDIPAQHWVIFVADEGGEDEELVFDSDFNGHSSVFPAQFRGKGSSSGLKLDDCKSERTGETKVFIHQNPCV